MASARADAVDLDGPRGLVLADRLPDGNTIVAENKRVRWFDPTGALVGEYKATWAVEVNRVPAR